MDELVERLYREAPLLDSMAKNVADALRSLGKTPLEGTEQVGDILRLSAARIQALETSLAEAEGRVKAITIALHDAIRRPMGQVPESADPFYSPAMAERAEARRVARSQALSELAALASGDSPSPPPVV